MNRLAHDRIWTAVAALAMAVVVLCGTAVSASAATKARLGQIGAEAGEGAGRVSFGTGVAVNRGGVGGVAPGSVFVSDSGNSRVDQFSAAGVFVRAFGTDVVASGAGDVGANETQTVAVRATGGAYTLTVTTATARVTTTAGSTTLTNVSGGLGEVHVGDVIDVLGIPLGATVVCVSPSPGCTTPGTLTVSQAATSTGDGRVTVWQETTGPIAAGAPASGAGSVQEALNALPGVGAGGVSVSGGIGDATGSAPYSVTFSSGPLAHDDLAPMTAATTLVDPLAGGSPTTGVTVATMAGGGSYEVCEAPTDRCKAGIDAATPGSVAGAENVAVDQDTGNVFVASATNRRIDVFSATGEFQGAFGRGVVTGGTGLEFCTTTCLAGINAATAGAFATNGLSQAALTIAPDGALYVGDRVNRRINEFALTHDGSDDVTGVSFTRAFGWGVRDGAAALQTCTTATGCLAGVAGGGPGQFPNNTPTDVAVDDDGLIYTVGSVGTCSAANPCRVQVFNPDGTFKQTFGPSTGGADSCQLSWTSGHWGGRAPYGIAIEPDTQHVYVTRRDSSTGTVNASAGTFEVCEFDSDGSLLSRSPVASLPTNNTGYLRLAFGSAGALYVNSPIAGSRGTISLLGEIPPPGVEILPTTAVTQTAATLNGRITIPAPGGDGFEPSYRFEYSADNGLTWQKAPSPDALAGSSAAGNVSVSEQLTFLQPNRTYRVRLVATIGESAVSGETMFTTDPAKPTLKRVQVLPVSDVTATLRGTVNPNSSHTNYRFEYGATAGYGSQAPAFEPYIGDGGSDQKVSVAISGLSPDTAYHYRLVATNETGVTYGADRVFTTHRCADLPVGGLSGCRRYELVSSADQGAIGQAGSLINPFYTGIQFQVDTVGDGVVYPVGYGYPGQGAGGDVNYRAVRGEGGWRSAQLTPDMSGPVTTGGGIGDSGRVLYLSEDLECGVVASHQLLASGAPVETVEAGEVNLFRLNPDGSYRTLTTEVPVNLAVPNFTETSYQFQVVGASADCGRIVFTTTKRYAGPGFSSTAARQLYEWDHGDMRALGVVPGAAGPVSAVAPGYQGRDYFNAVSGDASRVVFSASRAVSALPGEVGKPGLFVREDGVTVDVSMSETGVVDQGARFEDAAEDGSKVLFLANYGLAAGESSNGDQTSNCTAFSSSADLRCDLYAYDVETGDLTSLSETTAPANPNGAVVLGVLDSSDDGETVYFAAQGQLVAREGNTYAQNVAGAGAYNIYRSHGGVLSFVAVMSRSDVRGSSAAGALTSSTDKVGGGGGEAGWTTRATPDGRHLLFQAQDPVTGYDSGGVKEVYRYSAESETTVCVSCRADGLPSAGDVVNSVPLPGRAPYLRPGLTLSEDGSRAVFVSQDKLAPGGVDGDNNLYEWHDGVISLIYRGSTGGSLAEMGYSPLVGMSADGKNVYFRTTERLVAQDDDIRYSVYVARVDGGFASGGPGSEDCDPLAAGSCQGGGLVSVPPLLATGLPVGDAGSVPVRSVVSIGGVSRVERARASRRGVLRVRVRATTAGRVTVVARGRVGHGARRVGRAAVQVGAPGVVTVRLRLSSSALRALRSGRSLRLTVEARQARARPSSRVVLLPGGRR